MSSENPAEIAYRPSKFLELPETENEMKTNGSNELPCVGVSGGECNMAALEKQNPQFPKRDGTDQSLFF